VSPITSHALDLTLGRPARQLPLRLDSLDECGNWRTLAHAVTDEAGRVNELLHDGPIASGTYRLTFDTRTYLEATGQPVFYPQVDIVFHIEQESEHYHIPLLLSPFGYSTYRGS
jgi:5-hydroxyisourate hydrolase